MRQIKLLKWYKKSLKNEQKDLTNMRRYVIVIIAEGENLLTII